MTPEPVNLIGFSWQPEMRLKKSRDFRRVQGRGRKIRQPNLMLLVLPGQSGQTRIGLTVSRRVGNAVVRNRVKRWLREGLRQKYPEISGCFDVVVIAHPSAATSDQAEISRQLTAALDMAQLPPRPRGRKKGARR